jgi:hypothetical protein
MNILAAATFSHSTNANPYFLEETKKPLPDLLHNIETCFHQEIATPLYTSVDPRNTAYKPGTADTDLFLTGFNNLNQAYLINSVVSQDYTSLAGYCSTSSPLHKEFEPELSIHLSGERSNRLNKTHRNQNCQISIGDFSPCAALLINDLADKCSEILENVYHALTHSTITLRIQEAN